MMQWKLFELQLHKNQLSAFYSDDVAFVNDSRT